jgi:hypothetical protein
MQAMYLTKLNSAVALVLALGVVTLQHLGAQQPGPRLHEQSTPKEDAQRTAKLKRFIAAEANPRVNASGEVEVEGIPLADISEDKLKALLDAMPRSSKMRSLLKEQIEAAQTETTSRFMEFLAGRGTLDIMIGASQRLLQAERDLSIKKEDVVAAYEAHWQRMKDVEAINKGRYDAGRIAIQDYAQSRFNRIQAEIWLERVKAGAAPRPES